MLGLHCAREFAQGGSFGNHWLDLSVKSHEIRPRDVEGVYASFRSQRGETNNDSLLQYLESHGRLVHSPPSHTLQCSFSPMQKSWCVTENAPPHMVRRSAWQRHNQRVNTFNPVTALVRLESILSVAKFVSGSRTKSSPSATITRTINVASTPSA